MGIGAIILFRYKFRAIVSFILLIFTIALSNWLTNYFGLVTLLGITATAGTITAGLVFIERDLLHEYAGRIITIAAIFIAGFISWLVSSPELAVASAVTFLISESADFSVYLPLRKKGLIKAAIASNIVGFTVDTFLFLYLAGFPITVPIVLGQLIIKSIMTSIGVFIMWKWQHKLFAVPT